MKIFVEFADTEMITLKVKSSDTIENVKNMIWEKQSIPPNEQFLSIGCTQLEDGQTLAEYNIHNESVIMLLISSLPSIKISVQSTMGDMARLQVRFTDTIANVKTKIEDTTGVPRDYQKLYFEYQPLEDEWTIADCNIVMNSVIVLFLNLRDSMVILVNCLPDRPIFLEVESSDTIKKIKIMLWEKVGESTYDQELYYGNVLLEDGKTLAGYNILHDTMLMLY